MRFEALVRLLEDHNTRVADGRATEPSVAALNGASNHLAVYGSLAPGKVNHHHLETLVGEWTPGSVRGRLFDTGWGSNVGFPGFVWDENADVVPVQLFICSQLNAHWDRLDHFEGEDYQRILVPVYLGNAVVIGNIYAIARDGGES